MDHGKFFIPLANIGYMELPLAELPDSENDVNDLLEVLRAEAVPLELWLALAKVYLSENKVGPFLRLMEEACSQEAAEFYEDYSRIQMLCVLAAYHTSKGRMERGQPRRNEAFNRARQLLQEARRIDFSAQLPLIGTAQLALAQGNNEQARKDFEEARKLKDNGQVNVAPIVALANMALQAGNVDEALARYKRALLDHPGGPAEIRLGIAVCYYRKGNHERAQAAFERVLELDPKNIEALQGLAVMKFNGDDVKCKAEALEMLQSAFHFDPANSVVLNMLAHQHLLRGEYSKVDSLAKAALQLAEMDKTRANSLILLARAAHAMRKFPEAATHYQQAARLDETLALPHFGLAQMNLRNNEFKNAISELEAVLQAAPYSIDAARVLARLYKQQPQRVEKAIAIFFDKFDKTKQGGLLTSEVWELLGELRSNSNPKDALAAYSKALELGQQKGLAGADAARMMNNMAVLQLRLGNTQEAKRLMREALEEGAEEEALLSSVTMRFNMARVHEATANFKDAAGLYKEVLAEHPGYTACYLRLAAMAKAEGKRQEAMDWLSSAVEKSPTSAEGHAAMALLLMERKAYDKASKIAKQMLDMDKSDPCALVIKGNIAVGAAPSAKKHGQTQQDFEKQRKEYFDKALECYKLALNKEPSNAYAANGIGVVLAEEGSMATAKAIFTKVEEAVAANPSWQIVLPDAHLNLANVHLACQDYVSAIKMYQSVLSRHYHNKDSAVLLYLARAYYDSENLVEAKRSLLRAIHVAPTDPRLRFNLALVMQQHAALRLSQFKTAKLTPTEKLESVECAQEDLNQALRFFRRLNSLGIAASGIEEKKLVRHMEYCSDLAIKADSFYETATMEAEVAEKKLDSQRLALDAQKLNAQVAKEKQRLKEQREAEERERLALERLDKIKRLQEEWQQGKELMQSEREKEPAKKRKKKQDSGEPTMDELDDLEAKAEERMVDRADRPDGGVRHRIKKRQRSEADEQRRAEMAAVGLDSDDEDDGDAAGEPGLAEDAAPGSEEGHRRRGAVLDDDYDGGGLAGNGAPQAKANMEEIFGSSDSDED